MNWVDYCVIAIVVVSALVGLLRGFARETLNLGSWILAVIAAVLLAPAVGRLLTEWVALDSARLILSYLGVFIIALIIGSVVTHFVANAIRGTPFSGADRVLGSGFGAVRGGLLVIAIVALVGLTVIERETWWQESVLVPYFEPPANWVREQLPSEWINDIRPAPEDGAALPE